MANAKFDENSRATMICVSNADGLTIVPLQADPSTHKLKYDDNTTGNNNGNNSGIIMLDENSSFVLSALSSNGNGSLVELYADPVTKKILINSM